MGTKIYVVCLKCLKVHSMGQWHCDLSKAVTKGSKQVKEYKKSLTPNEQKESYWIASIEDALKIARAHTDKKHKVIVAYEG